MKKKDFTRAGTFSGKRIGTALCAATFLMCGCGNENETAGTDTDGRVPLQVSAGIQTRAYDDRWNKDDAIGIYMLNGADAEASNKKYTTTDATAGGTFSATGGDIIYFPTDGSTRDFIAYYPHRTDVTADGTYTVNLGSQTPQKDIDLMRSTKVTGKHKDDASVAFRFSHKLVKIEINIEAGTGMEGVSLAGTKVTLTNQPLTGTFNVLAEDAKATADDATEEKPLQNIEFCTASDGSKYEAIVFPAASTANMDMKFIVPALSETVPFTFTVNKAEKSQKFEAGRKYLYTITVNKIGLGVTSTIEPWGEGNGEGGETGSAE